MKVIIIAGVLITGCAQTQYKFEPLPPEPLIKRNLVEKTVESPPEDGRKGPFPPG